MTQESGRSMVEIIATLSVMGILSVGGIAGYNTVMKKHFTNELITGANQRATVAAQQLALGRELEDITLNEFSTNAGKNAYFSKSVIREGDEFFNIPISGLDNSTCMQLVSTAGETIRHAACRAENDGSFTANLIYHRDLSPTEGTLAKGDVGISGGTGNAATRNYDGNREGCEAEGYQYCTNDTCITKNEVCPTGSSNCSQYPKTSENNTGGKAGNNNKGDLCRCPANKIYLSDENKCIPACSGHGTLDTNENCICHTGYTGEVCEKECSDHGTKDSSGKCVCKGGYTGDYCNAQLTCITGTWTEDGCKGTCQDYQPDCQECDVKTGATTNYGEIPCDYNGDGKKEGICHLGMCMLKTEPKQIWSDWMDSGKPEPGLEGGDFETFDILSQKGYSICQSPLEIECRAQLLPNVSLEKLGQKVECSETNGLTCYNKEQSPPLCLNYQIRILCSEGGGEWVPRNGYAVNNDAVIKCPDNSTCTSSDNFTCNDGFYKDGNQCKKIVCSDHGTKDSSGKCICKGGYEGSNCETKKSCGPDLCCTWTEDGLQQTYAQPGEYLENCTRAPCPAGTYSKGGYVTGCQTCDGITNDTRSECSPCDGVVSSDGKQCLTCPIGSYYDLDTGNDPDGTHCVTCPPEHVKKCSYKDGIVCEDGYELKIENYGAIRTCEKIEPSCEPHCHWTEWFDMDYPKYEEGGGDFETYEKIRGAGGDICRQPQEIECEAENDPGVPLEQVGQQVHCDIRFGLVCRNDEQLGLFKMCYNYRMRVLCCDYSHCEQQTE